MKHVGLLHILRLHQRLRLRPPVRLLGRRLSPSSNGDCSVIRITVSYVGPAGNRFDERKGVRQSLC